MAERGGREGQRLGNYHLVRLLGHGGFADVYLAEHLYLKTPAAIKLLRMKVVSTQVREEFLKEAQTIAGLNHPHIVRTLDFGVEKKTPFLVMDYAPNGTLRQRYAPGARLPLPTTLSYVRQVADALHYAHEEKVIHRDIKPENMLVGRRDEVLLSDFGIALLAQTSRQSSTEEVAGTVGYMAPEQIEGRPVPASDQYALGVVVYEWLCGELPFRGTFKEVCTQHLFVAPPSLHEKLPLLSANIEQVVMKALAKEPQQRFADVRAFADALEEASHTQTPLPVLPPQETSTSSHFLPPTVLVTPTKYDLPQTERVIPAAPVSQPSQVQKTVAAPTSTPRPLPLFKRLKYVLNIGLVAGIMSALFHIVIVLLYAPVFQRATQEIVSNRLTVNTALALVGVQGLKGFLSLLIFFLAGFAAGKMAEQRGLGFLAGIIGGALLFGLMLVASYIPSYPDHITIGRVSIFGNSATVSLLLLMVWMVGGGLICLLGAWLATKSGTR
jgi:serine/threonine protein kinase